MYLEKLEIQGFKSFAHPTTLVFNRDLTVIVGPNGSGKSNVADAVRWVLGEQSVKTLRGKKSEDVIFAGSDKKNKLGFAQASLYLNNKDKQADVDYEQIIITRKVERNGDSEYLINNNKVRLLDVQLLLAKANFGQRTYSVIGQGMIDSILVSSAQERKEFFDEATGVKQFQIKKNQSVNKLSNAKNNLEQTGKILAELEPRLRSLTRQVKKLEKRESLAKELTDLQTNYYSFLRGNLDKSLGEKRTSFQIAQKKVADLNQQLIELQTKLEKEETTSSRQDNFEILQDKLGQHQNELNTLLKEKTILEGRSDLKLMSSGQSDVVWLKQRIDNLRNDINKNSLLSKEKKSKLNNSQDEVNILEAKREQVLAAFSKLEERLLSNGHDLSPEEMASKVNNILNQQKDFQTTLNTLISLDDLPKLKEICYSITESMSSLAKKIKVNKEEDKKHWKEEFNKMLSSKDNLVAEISEARTSLAILENELQQLGTQVAKDTEELNKLDSDKKALLDKSGGNEENKKQLDTLVKQIEFKNKEVEDIEKQIKEFNESEDGKKRSLVEAQRTFREVQANFNSKNSQLNEVKVDLARLETREEELNREISEEIPSLQVISVKEFNPAEAKDKIYKLKNQLSIIGGIDEVVEEEYQEVNERYTFLKEQSDDLAQAIAHLEKIIKDLEESISKQFDKSFKNINILFNQYFKKLFSGGKAELILDISEMKKAKTSNGENGEVEDLDEEEVEVKKQYGIEIKAVPPGKKLSGINMLSGGEKALTSIALISAIIANNPSPFVVLDEVDAALDEANSIRFSEILDELSSKTQFIAITHNRATMHKAKIIYGVTMGDDGISKLLSMNFDEADEIAS
ncbi:MAG: AAA family ATPase [Candidatus Komeilibacteria bacterium]|jgi:chromosome segregation protein|nr:AAA family ATPase [Candidatus Komeilibacteria bacterium]